MLDLQTKTPPPLKKSSNTSTTSPKRSSQPSKREMREDGLNGMFQLAGGLSLMFGQWADAGACSTHGGNIAREAAELAEKYEKVGGVLDYITAVGPFAGLLTAVLPFGLQILVNHDRLPAHPALAQIGVLPKDMLASKAQAEVMELQAKMAEEMAAAQRAQAEAQAKLENAKLAEDNAA